MRPHLIASIGLAALLVGAGGAWYVVRQEREFQTLIANGNASLTRGDTYGAIEAFSGALALHEDSMLAYLRRGDAYRRRGELPAALRDLRQAARLDPSATDPVELSADVNVALGRYARAIEDYKAFLTLDDQSARVLYKLALTSYRDQRIDEAIGAVRAALAIDSASAEAHYLLGVCLWQRASADEALRSLNQALAINPALIAAREQLAEIYRITGRPRESLDQLEALSALEPTRADRLINVALAYADWGRTAAAVHALDRAAERFPSESAVRTALGSVWLKAAERQGDADALGKALDALRPVALSANAPPDALALFGRALLLSGQPSSAERVLLEAANQTPVQPMALEQLVEAATRLGHRSTAREAGRRYAVLMGQDPSIPR